MLSCVCKQIGMAVAIMRGSAHPESIQFALDSDRDYNVPMAPELGLFLVGVLESSGIWGWGVRGEGCRCMQERDDYMPRVPALGST